MEYTQLSFSQDKTRLTQAATTPLKLLHMSCCKEEGYHVDDDHDQDAFILFWQTHFKSEKYHHHFFYLFTFSLLIRLQSCISLGCMHEQCCSKAGKIGKKIKKIENCIIKQVERRERSRFTDIQVKIISESRTSFGRNMEVDEELA